MKEENINKLLNIYPELFKELKFGFECGDGWTNILEALCECIININYENKPQMTFVQIKEKFGLLRIYTNNTDEFMDGMIAMAESMSSKICEYCGSTKDISSEGGYIQTLCKECRSKNG